MKYETSKIPEKPNIQTMSAAMWRDICHLHDQPHRHFHTIDHVMSIIKEIENRQEYRNDLEAQALKWAACFHDIVYYPGSKTNEQDSINVFDALLVKHAKKNVKTNPEPLQNVELKNLVTQIIKDTAVLVRSETVINRISLVFNKYDRLAVSDSSFVGLMAYSEKIYKEYAFVDYREFVETHRNIVACIRYSANPLYKEWLESRRIRVGVYAGSFNPFHLGHYDVFKQASKVFDKVIIAIGENPDKVDPSARPFVRNWKVGSSVANWNIPVNTHVVKFSGSLDSLVEHYRNAEPNYDITIVKGLRNASDLDHESVQRKFLKDLDPKIKHAYFITNPMYAHISSSALRSLASLGKEIDDYVP